MPHIRDPRVLRVMRLLADGESVTTLEADLVAAASVSFLSEWIVRVETRAAVERALRQLVNQRLDEHAVLLNWLRERVSSAPFTPGADTPPPPVHSS